MPRTGSSGVAGESPEPGAVAQSPEHVVRLLSLASLPTRALRCLSPVALDSRHGRSCGATAAGAWARSALPHRISISRQALTPTLCLRAHLAQSRGGVVACFCGRFRALCSASCDADYRTGSLTASCAAMRCARAGPFFPPPHSRSLRFPCLLSVFALRSHACPSTVCVCVCALPRSDMRAHLAVPIVGKWDKMTASCEEPLCVARRWCRQSHMRPQHTGYVCSRALRQTRRRRALLL